MELKDVKFTIIIPTSGRPSLYATLHSIYSGGVQKSDAVIVVGDGAQPEAQRIVQAFKDRLPVEYHETPATRMVGNFQRNYAMKLSTGTHLLFMDDDDVYAPNALSLVRSTVAKHEGKIVVFKMRGLAKRLPYDVLWREPELRIGNIGTPMFAVPNAKGKLGEWGNRYAGDFDFIESTVAKFASDSIIWIDEVIAYIR